MIKHEDRLLFLKEFTRHLILNSKKPYENYQELIQEFPQPMLPSFIPQQVRPVEIKARELSPIPSPRFAMNFNPSINSQHAPQFMLPSQSVPNMPETNVPQIRQPAPRLDFQPQMVYQPPQEYAQPQPMPLPPGFNLGKLNFILFDPRVTTIECPGPGKLILVRTYGRNTVTKISLTNDEISSLLDKFSREAKIPVISGLFKAAVGNLILTAVVSELVGTRFIINKITPNFAIEQINKGF